MELTGNYNCLLECGKLNIFLWFYLIRWFDKSFNLIVCADGTAGLNFEHSWGDGVGVLRYFQDISKDTSENPRCHPKNLNQEFNSDSLDVKKIGDYLKIKFLYQLDLNNIQ